MEPKASELRDTIECSKITSQATHQSSSLNSLEEMNHVRVAQGKNTKDVVMGRSYERKRVESSNLPVSG